MPTAITSDSALERLKIKLNVTTKIPSSGSARNKLQKKFSR